MYCSQCGKKVNDTMLFCPFCGKAIVIPEQDEAENVHTLDFESLEKTAANDDKMKSMDAESDFEGDDLAVSELNDGAVQIQSDASKEAPSGEADETQAAAAELLDWSQSRRDYSGDVWADRESPGEAFEPLDLDSLSDEAAPQDEWREEIAKRKQASAPAKQPPRMGSQGTEPVRLDGVAPKLEKEAKGASNAKPGKSSPKKANRKHANTLVPPKTMDPNDIFMDNRRTGFEEFSDMGKDDDFDAPEFETDAYVYEDEAEASFFMRHLRGFVGLALLAILILMFVIYAFSNAGQLTLARVNLAWSAKAYDTLGYQSYESGQFTQAGLYYERALQRNPDNYNFASAAAMAYIEAGNSEKAEAMLKRCIEIDPAPLEPYIYLLNMYPSAAQRPWDVTQLLQQGYQITGDDRLKVTG